MTGFTWTASGSPAATPSPTATATPTPTPTTQPPAATPQPPDGTVHPPPHGGAADPTGAVLGAQVFSLPSGRRCVSRRAFRISLRRPKDLVFTSLKITVNRKAKVKLTGLKARRIKAWVNLRGLPRGRFTVQIVAVTTTGRKAVSKRTYRTCATRGAMKPKVKQRRPR